MRPTTYFYPRPPRGGRHCQRLVGRADIGFLSTPSARRATMVVLPASTPRIFLSTPSARRATAGLAGCHGRSQISIHALREEGDDSPETKTAGARDFYPRPPRGGRLQEAGKAHWCRQFLSTPSARRATPDDETRAMLKEFLSTPSARRATNKEHEGMSKWPFLSTPSARRATPLRGMPSRPG